MVQHVLAGFAHAAIGVLGRTTEFRSENEDHWRRWILEERRQAIFAFWHNQILLASWYLISRWIWHGAHGSAMISASRDGGRLSALLARLGVQPIRGSTSRRGAVALRGMLTQAQAGHLLAITPDGPRGPAYQVQSGILQLARLTGIPICPVAAATNSFATLSSWDHFTIPLPFGRARVCFGTPLWVAAETPLETARQALKQQLDDATRRVYRQVGRRVPPPGRCKVRSSKETASCDESDDPSPP